MLGEEWEEQPNSGDWRFSLGGRPYVDPLPFFRQVVAGGEIPTKIYTYRSVVGIDPPGSWGITSYEPGDLPDKGTPVIALDHSLNGCLFLDRRSVEIIWHRNTG